MEEFKNYDEGIIKEMPKSVEAALPIEVKKTTIFLNPIFVENGKITAVLECEKFVKGEKNLIKSYPIFVEILTNGETKRVSIRDIQPLKKSLASEEAVKSLKLTFPEKMGV